MSAVAEVGTQVFMIPGDATDPVDPSVVGASLEMPFWVNGRQPQRTERDVVMSVQKHMAEVLDERCSDYLSGYDSNGDPAVSEAWEVRPWSEQSSFHLPFARVAVLGPVTISGGAVAYADYTQSITVHLYPHPAQDAENAIMNADRLRSIVTDALRFGAVRTAGLGPVIPLWDFALVTGLYGDSEARLPNDYFRVNGVSVDRVLDPEDDRYAWVVVNFRAQWRRASSSDPGLLVQSVRMEAHPE